MKRLITAVSAVFLASTLFGAAFAGSYPKQKVVYHVNGDNPKQQSGAMRKIQNHINAVGAENLELRVVMHGNGVSLVMLPEALKSVPKAKAANADIGMQATIDKLKSQGVQFKVCANTLKGRNISRADHLYDVEETDIVPSGVAELAHLQGQGYTYIKP